MEIAIFIVGAAFILVLITFLLRSRSSQSSETERMLHDEHAKIRAERDELAGKGKEMYAHNVTLKAELSTLQRERDSLQKQVAKFEAEEKNREQIFTDKVQKLERIERALDDERKRIRAQDEAEKQFHIEERDRIWNEHQKQVHALMTDLCKDPNLEFRLFDDTHLPASFDGSFKPDIAIEFLDQYVVFDAKTSRSENLQLYLSNQVKSTALKIKKDSKIYPTIFFVVPTQALTQLPQKYRYFFEAGYSFYVISPESIAPILASFKKIATYEFADQLDPRERENIINLITAYDVHINFRNAVDLLVATKGNEVLEKAALLEDSLRDEIQLKKEQIRTETLQPGDIRKLMISPEAQVKRLEELHQSQRPSRRVERVSNRPKRSGGLKPLSS